MEDSQFRRLLADVQSTTEVELAFGGFVAPGSVDFAITRTTGARTKALQDLQISCGLGLGGKAMTLRRPVWVSDYSAAGGITHHYDQAVRAERLRSVFAIPLVTADGVQAVVYGAMRRQVPFGDRTLRTADLAIRRALRAEAPREEPSPETLAAPLAQSLRTAHAELSAIAAEVDDPALRDRIVGVCGRMIEPLAPANPATGVTLTPRELAVLTQVAQGCTNTGVGERLGILPGTVKAYLQSAMRKLGARNRTSAVCEARRLGLLP